MSDPTASVAVSSLIVDVAPYALALIPVVIGWGVSVLRTHTKIQFSQAAVDKIDTLAKAEAGAAIAASETNLAGVSIHVGSAIVADAANRIIDGAPAILADAGLSADNVATMVAGHIGAIQASSAAPAAAPVVVVPAPAASATLAK
jgi:hypothetical protein